MKTIAPPIRHIRLPARLYTFNTHTTLRYDNGVRVYAYHKQPFSPTGDPDAACTVIYMGVSRSEYELDEMGLPPSASIRLHY